jgi:hypothetical protein
MESSSEQLAGRARRGGVPRPGWGVRGAHRAALRGSPDGPALAVPCRVRDRLRPWRALPGRGGPPLQQQFVVLVGQTARGRKGSSWGHVRRLLEDADGGFARCVVGGLSSGEGLIAQVRDGEDSHAPVDKRRLVVEPEFAQVLKVLAREGNTLSAIVRTVGTQAQIG